ncbi:hypothetical protein PYX08_19915 [Citrobacter freundii]|nr:hypothetical protein [Citrobacter freundii]MDO3404993.1 hypothetical protein [Citrobacter freundii]
MDGVLIDSNEVIERAWREAADMYGKTISEDEIIKHIHGQPGPHTIRALFSDLPLVDQQKSSGSYYSCRKHGFLQPYSRCL